MHAIIRQGYRSTRGRVAESRPCGMLLWARRAAGCCARRAWHAARTWSIVSHTTGDTTMAKIVTVTVVRQRIALLTLLSFMAMC